MNKAGPLLTAMATSGEFGRPPEQVRSFDRITAGGTQSEPPDFYETSPRVAEQVSPWRLTHYFDLAGRGTDHRAGVYARFVELCNELGMPGAEHLSPMFERAAPVEPALRQLCIGLDCPRDPQSIRVKLYAIMEGKAEAWTVALAGLLGVDPPAEATLDLTHIVGLDFTAGGLHDVKLYFAMDPKRVSGTLRNRRRAAELLNGCRRVVYQQSLLVAGKKSMHFHADAPRVLDDELVPLRSTVPASAEFERRLAGLRERAGMEPWILAHPFADGELDRSVYSLYLHLP